MIRWHIIWQADYLAFMHNHLFGKRPYASQTRQPRHLLFWQLRPHQRQVVWYTMPLHRPEQTEQPPHDLIKVTITLSPLSRLQMNGCLSQSLCPPPHDHIWQAAPRYPIAMDEADIRMAYRHRINADFHFTSIRLANRYCFNLWRRPELSTNCGLYINIPPIYLTHVPAIIFRSDGGRVILNQ